MELVQQILHEEEDFLVEILNSYLVSIGQRRSTLFESNAWKKAKTLQQRIKVFDKLNIVLLQPLNLTFLEDKFSLEKYPRWFIIKPENKTEITEILSGNTHADIAKALGFFAYHNHFGDYTKYRIEGAITANGFRLNTEVYVRSEIDEEEFEKYLREKSENWSNHLRPLNFSCKYRMATVKPKK
jgi:hypothetical protein